MADHELCVSWQQMGGRGLVLSVRAADMYTNLLQERFAEASYEWACWKLDSRAVIGIA
jgi:hypothetical protein